MTCYSPIEAYQYLDGGPLLFKKPTDKPVKQVKAPCRNCIGCRLARSQEAAIRITHERTLHEEAAFVTLTYDDEHLPHDGSLSKRELQLFFKNLRNWATREHDKKIRYYAAGEYGDKLGRPHYHICLFGIDFPDKELISSREGIYLYESKILANIWGKGICSTGDVDYQSAAYVARYIMKKIVGERAEEHYQTTHPITGEVINLEPEFNVMSNRPGIGKDWYKKFESDCFPSDYLIRKGSRIPIPKYYDKLFQETEPEQFELIKEQRIQAAKKRRHDNTPERLAVREYCKMRSISNLSRNLHHE